ncbi:hypothetical protein [Pseudomonas putida]|uniref:DUF5464 family protein n=1 Tax=Pseudomonas putida TaxID=303 RepID=UPI0006A0A90E|nr:hypothetical protein [Pseudomonas putida]KMY35989.1 hypothetical protein AA993_09485 [Pseudomonas putida]
MFKKVGKFLAALAAILTLAYILAVYPQVALVVVGACYLAAVCACVWSIVPSLKKHKLLDVRFILFLLLFYHGSLLPVFPDLAT